MPNCKPRRISVSQMPVPTSSTSMTGPQTMLSFNQWMNFSTCSILQILRIVYNLTKRRISAHNVNLCKQKTAAFTCAVVRWPLFFFPAEQP